MFVFALAAERGERQQALEVVVLGAFNQRGDQRRGYRYIEGAGQHVGDEKRRHRDFAALAGARVNHRNRRRSFFQPLHQRAQAVLQIGVLGIAGRGLCAIGGQQVERTLHIARKEHRQPHVGRRDAVEDRGADAIAVLAQVDQSGAGAVGAAVNVDLVVAEERAHVVEVVHRDRGRVKTKVGVVAGEAFLQERDVVGVGAREGLERVVFVLAVQGV